MSVPRKNLNIYIYTLRHSTHFHTILSFPTELEKSLIIHICTPFFFAENSRQSATHQCDYGCGTFLQNGNKTIQTCFLDSLYGLK